MNKQGLTLLGIGLGALVGAALSKTKVGQELNEKLEEAFGIFKNEVVPVCKELGFNKNNSTDLMEV